MRQPTWPVTARTPGYSSPAINSAGRVAPKVCRFFWGGGESKCVTRTLCRTILRRYQFNAPLSYCIFRARYVQARQELRRARRYFQTSLSILLASRINLRKLLRRHIEPADHLANAYLMGLYVDRRLVSSLRLQIGCATTPNFSSLELFPNILERLLRSNKTVVDMGCVATDGDIARPYVWLPYLILRSWIIAAEHFHADYIAAAMRPQHQLFYKRALNCEVHSELRLLPHHLTSVGRASYFVIRPSACTKISHFFAPHPVSDTNYFSMTRRHLMPPGSTLRSRKTAETPSK